MTAIEDARAALRYATRYPSERELVLESALSALIAEHEHVLAHPLLATVDLNASATLDLDELEPAPAPPTDDEREALRPIISEARRIQRPDYPNASTDDEVIDAVLAAGFRRQGPTTDEWEFEADAD